MRVALGQAAVPGVDPVPISWQAMAAVVVTIALLAAAAWLLRRSRAHLAGVTMRVETALPLGERRSLVIVTVEGRRLLLGMTPHQVALVTELHKPFQNTLDETMRGEGPS